MTIRQFTLPGFDLARVTQNNRVRCAAAALRQVARCNQALAREVHPVVTDCAVCFVCHSPCAPTELGHPQCTGRWKA
jgi:hypothetical protein